MERTLDGSELSGPMSCWMSANRLITGERFLVLADGLMQGNLHGLISLPFSVKTSAIAIIYGDVDRFRQAAFTSAQATSMLHPYINAIAAALQENNVKVSVHDGTSIRADLSSDSFPFVAEMVFNELQRSGTVRSTQLRDAVNLFLFEEIGRETSYTIQTYIRSCESKLDLDAFTDVSRRMLSAIAANLANYPIAILV